MIESPQPYTPLESPLPETPDESEFRGILLELRRKDLQENLRDGAFDGASS